MHWQQQLRKTFLTALLERMESWDVTTQKGGKSAKKKKEKKRKGATSDYTAGVLHSHDCLRFQKGTAEPASKGDGKYHLLRAMTSSLTLGILEVVPCCTSPFSHSEL